MDSANKIIKYFEILEYKKIKITLNDGTILFSNLEEFEDVYWDNFIFDYLRNVIGLNDWDIGKLMSFEEVCIEVRSESDDSCDSCDDSVWYYLDCFRLFKKTGNDEYIEIVDFESIG